MEQKDGKETQADKTKQEVVEYDQLLATAGEFGLYQCLLFMKTGPFFLMGAFVYFTQMFMTEVPKNHWCRIPELENLTVEERRSLAIPQDSSNPLGYSHCTSYVANWSEVLRTGVIPNTTWETQNCRNGWEYDLTEIPYPTIGTELGWVCKHDSYQATAQSFFFVGCIIGGFVLGWVVDRFGRIPALAIANAVACIAGVASIFARSFVEFTLSRVLMGVAYDNCMIIAYVLILEYTAPKHRTLLSNLSMAVFFTIGVTTLPWIALACGDWKILSVATSIPLVLCVFIAFLLPESPQWLISRGRIQTVVKNIKAVAKIHKKEIPEKLIDNFERSCKKNEHADHVNILELLKRPKLRNMFICACVEYLCCMMIFEGSLRAMGSLKFDIFISFSVISFTEFPSLVLLSFILDLTGRKWMSLTSLSICAVFNFLIPFVGGGIPSVACAVVARFATNLACNSIMQWSAELLPTPVRGSGIAIIHICGFIATCIAPFIAYLDNYVSGLSFIIVAALSVFTGAICIYLPETARKEMPQTFEDAEDMMRNRTLWRFPCANNKNMPNANSGQDNCNFEMN